MMVKFKKKSWMARESKNLANQSQLKPAVGDNSMLFSPSPILWKYHFSSRNITLDMVVNYQSLKYLNLVSIFLYLYYYDNLSEYPSYPRQPLYISKLSMTASLYIYRFIITSIYIYPTHEYLSIYPPVLPFLSSVATFSNRRSARIKKLI